MLRFSTRRLFASTAVLRSHHELLEGFDYFERKVVDKDIHSNYEHKESLSLTLTRQDEFIMKEHNVRCVTLPTTNGETGVFPGHEYQIAKLIPAPIVVEMMDGSTRKYFTSGGFAHINNEGSCDINTVECIPFSDLDLESAEKALAEQQAALASAKDEHQKAVVEIRVEVLEAVIHALKH